MTFLLATALGCASRPAQPTVAETRPKSEVKSVAPGNGREAGSTGVPSGYTGRTDDVQSKLEEVKYRSNGSGWAIATGPAHIMYSPRDTMKGEFIIASTFNQKELEHPASFGLFVGGTELDKPSQRYTYFVIRGSGEYSVWVREGAETRGIIPWTAQQPLGRPVAAWRVRHRLAIRVRDDSVRFLYNGAPIAAVKVGTVPTDGIAGFRLDRNLRVTVDRLRASS